MRLYAGGKEANARRLSALNVPSTQPHTHALGGPKVSKVLDQNSSGVGVGIASCQSRTRQSWSEYGYAGRSQAVDEEEEEGVRVSRRNDHSLVKNWLLVDRNTRAPCFFGVVGAGAAVVHMLPRKLAEKAP